MNNSTQAISENEVLSQIIKLVQNLSIDSLTTLNHVVVDNIKIKRKIQGFEVRQELNLKIGDKVEFTSNKRGRGVIQIKITGFSRDLSKVKGSEINGLGAWQVPCAMVRKIG